MQWVVFEAWEGGREDSAAVSWGGAWAGFDTGTYAKRDGMGLNGIECIDSWEWRECIKRLTFGGVRGREDITISLTHPFP